MSRYVAAAVLVLGCLLSGAGVSAAATTNAINPGHGARPTQCNGDPAFDPSNDPVHCHYAHPFSDMHWWRHRHHH